MAFVIALILTCTSLLGLLIFIVFIIPHYLLLCQDLSTYFVTSFRIVPWHIYAFFLSIGICWFLARKLDNMHTINGSGTKLFGHTPSGTGYIATRWISMFFFPVLPLASYEVFHEQRDSREVGYSMNRLDKLAWLQIVQTAVKSIVILAIVIGLIVVLLNFNCFK